MPEKSAEKAYIIDFGDRGYEDVRKCVTFIKGVGLLDHTAVSQHRPDIYGTGNGSPYPRPSGQYANFELLSLAEYFANHGCLVTEITEEESETLRKDLVKGTLPPKKYLKASGPAPAPKGTASASGAKGTEKKEGSGPVSETDLEPGPSKGRGKGKGGK